MYLFTTTNFLCLFRLQMTFLDFYLTILVIFNFYYKVLFNAQNKKLQGDPNQNEKCIFNSSW